MTAPAMHAHPVIPAKAANPHLSAVIPAQTGIAHLSPVIPAQAGIAHHPPVIPAKAGTSLRNRNPTAKPSFSGPQYPGGVAQGRRGQRPYSATQKARS